MKYFSGLLFFISLSIIGYTQNDSLRIKKIFKKTEFSGQLYLYYNYDINENVNEFALKRSYFTFMSNLNRYVSVRYTQDITIDDEGNDAGNVEFRMKYMYMKIKPFRKGVLKNSYTEIGMVHRPFIDFEEHINTYRSQDAMFAEKTGIVNSADFGILFAGLIGEKSDGTNLRSFGKNMHGKYGSFAFGIFNGGGYHSAEYNKNKTFEGRLTIRPFPEFIPGLQFTYAGIYGKGNTPVSSDFIMNLGMMSFENSLFVLTGQYYFGTGDYEGRYLNANGNAARNNGHSFFGEFKIPKTSFAFFGRYDNFSSNQVSDYFKTGYFTGISYRFLKSKVFVCYGQDKIGNEKDEMFELVLDVVF